MISLLSAFGGIAAFVEDKFGDGIRLFVKVEICCFLKNKAIPHRLDVGFAPSFFPIKRRSPSSLIHTSLIHLRLFVVLPNCFGFLLFASILRKLIYGLKFVFSFSLVGVVR